MGRSSSDCAVLVTGASGFLGGLVTAVLLADERRRVVLPIRATSDPSNCRQRVRLALLDYGVSEPEADSLMELATIVELSSLDRFNDFTEAAVVKQVDEIVHCAGCVDYFDEPLLRRANVDLTDRLLRFARERGVWRFIYLSTAYCAGYRTDVIPEQLHEHPAAAAEPTPYTRSKRTAEWLVADSGVPFVIIRPSIVIGDSRSGKYTGKNYGLYQMWRAIEGLLCREYSPIWYTVAPPTPVNLVHQDAFQSAFMEMYRRVRPDGIAHLVDDDSDGPTMRDLCWLWADVYCPIEIHSYARVDDVPLRSLPARQRRFLELAWKNFEISTHTWRFETKRLDELRATGLVFANATLETVARCQRRYIERSPRIQEHMRRYGGGTRPRLVELAPFPQSPRSALSRHPTQA
jgi:nucleoside-diphosphate-sugar epimerase